MHCDNLRYIVLQICITQIPGEYIINFISLLIISISYSSLPYEYLRRFFIFISIFHILKNIQGGVVMIFYLWLFSEIQFPHHWRSFHLCSKFPNLIFQISEIEIEIHFHARKGNSWNVFLGQIWSLDLLEILQWYSGSKWKWRSITFWWHVCPPSCSILLICPTRYFANGQSRLFQCFEYFNTLILSYLEYFYGMPVLYPLLLIHPTRYYANLSYFNALNTWILEYLNT